jgi:hypothetical protein
MTDTGYGTGVKHLLEQAAAHHACVLSTEQVAEVAGTMVAMSDEMDQMTLVLEMQLKALESLKEFIPAKDWPKLLDQMGILKGYEFDEEE